MDVKRIPTGYWNFWLIKKSNFYPFRSNLQFDSYLRSLKIDQNSLCLVTDGQLPLRQCLHPESSAKDIHLPSYYWKFSDLKKEYPQTKPDLSRALIPIADVMKLPNMPAPSAPTTISSLADILSGELNFFFSRAFSVSFETHIFFRVCRSWFISNIIFCVWHLSTLSDDVFCRPTLNWWQLSLSLLKKRGSCTWHAMEYVIPFTWSSGSL
jgi:hypothetical protein